MVSTVSEVGLVSIVGEASLVSVVNKKAAVLETPRHKPPDRTKRKE